MHNGTQGYGVSDTNRQKYALLERDSTTGLDHTWWRKYESAAGRWTSPDPMAGTIDDPQSNNRYSYARNDPVNFIDPTGLFIVVISLDCHSEPVLSEGRFVNGRYGILTQEVCSFSLFIVGFDREPAERNTPPQKPKQELCDGLRKLINDIINRVRGPEGGLKGLRYRYSEQINGRYGPGTPQWENHENEFTKQQRQLGRALDAWDMNNCGPPPPGARKWSSKDAPSPKQWINAHQPVQSSYSINWRHVGIGVGAALVIVGVVGIVAATCPLCAVVAGAAAVP